MCVGGGAPTTPTPQVSELGDPATRRLTEEGLARMQQRLRAYLRLPANVNSDAVFRAAVAKYLHFLKNDGVQLLEDVRQTVDDFLLVFSNFIQIAVRARARARARATVHGAER